MSSPAQAPVHTGRVVAVLASAGVLAALMQTLVVPLVGDLPRLLNASASDASWALTATLLAGAVATPVSGRLGDLYGKRRLLLLSLLPLIAGSVVCALSSSLAPMVVGRTLQGTAMGLVPLGISAMRDILPPQRLGSAIALMSASMGIGGTLGLPIAAAIAENTNWHMLFWVMAAAGVLVGALIWWQIPSTPASASGGFDYLGAVGLSGGLLCLLLGVSKGADWGWSSGSTVGCFAASVVLLLLWGLWELRIPAPLIDLRITARRQVLLTNLASTVVGFAMYAQALIVPQFLQLPAATGYGLDQSMLAAGLWMLPGGLAMMVMAPLGARVSGRFGPKVTLSLGSLVIAGGYGSSLLLMHSVWGAMTFSLIIGCGVALGYGAMPALIMGAVPHTETAAANGFNTLMRAIGTSASSAVLGVILAHLTISVGERTFPSEAGFRTCFIIAGCVALVAAAIAASIPTRRSPHEDGPARRSGGKPARATVS